MVSMTEREELTQGLEDLERIAKEKEELAERQRQLEAEEARKREILNRIWGKAMGNGGRLPPPKVRRAPESPDDTFIGEVLKAVREDPGYGPTHYWEAMEAKGVKTESANPVKMTSISLQTLKGRGLVMNLGIGRWVPTSAGDE